MNNQGLEPNELKAVPPKWLWIGIRLGFVALVVGGLGLVVAVATGVADPQPVGSLKWEDHFTGTQRWESFGSGVAFKDGALEIGVGANGIGANGIGANEVGGAVTQINDKDFSFEVAGGQVTGEVGAAYGIVFNYIDPQHYTAVLINGNSYVEVVGADGQQFMDWQEWPNILLNYEANRLRVDVQNGQALIRINDEVLTTVAATRGGVGVLARGSAAGQGVRFGWAKYWSR